MEKLAAVWARAGTRVDAEPSSEVIDLGDSAFIPDFVLRHAETGDGVFLEVLGFWTPEHLRERLLEFDHAGRHEFHPRRLGRPARHPRPHDERPAQHDRLQTKPRPRRRRADGRRADWAGDFRRYQPKTSTFQMSSVNCVVVISTGRNFLTISMLVVVWSVGVSVV